MLRLLPFALAGFLLAGAVQAQVRTQADENALVRATLTNNIRDIELLRREVVGLTSVIEALRREIAGIRGAVEVYGNDINQLRSSSVNPAYVQATGQLAEQLSQQVGQQLKTLDERLKALEPSKVAYDGLEFMVANDERRDFDGAFSAVKAADFGRAKDLFQQFVGRYPQSGYLPSAQFWLASSYYGLADCKSAMPILDVLVRYAPASFTRTPEVMLLQSNCHGELKDVAQQRLVLGQITSRFPTSDAARLASERLRTLQ